MSPAPRFSTADIAKGAQERQDERLEQERAAERAERDRTTAPHITGSEPAPLPGITEPDAATIRAEETRAERDTDAAIARAATVGTTTSTPGTTSAERQLAEDS